MNAASKNNKVDVYRWSGYILILFAYCLVIFHRLSLGAAKAELEAIYGISALQYSNLSAAYFYTYAFMQIPAGILADSLGSRKTAFAGCLFMGLGACFYGLAGSYPVLLAARALVGFGASGMFLSILKYETVWFDETRFGTITGVTSLLSNLAGCLAQAPLALLIAWLSWKMTFLSVGALTVVTGVLVLLVAIDRPSDKGLPPVSGAAPQDKEKVSISEGMKGVLSSRYIYPVLLVNFCANGIFVTMMNWSIPYLSDVFGMSPAGAGKITLFIPVCAALTGLLCGRISDRITNRKMINILLAFVLLILFAMLRLLGDSLVSLPLSVLVVILSGLGMVHVINYGLVKDICNIKYSGMATSVLNVATFLGSSIIPVIFGAIIEKNGTGAASYGIGFGMLAAFAALEFAASFLILETNCRNHYQEIKEGQYKKSVLSIR